MGYQLPIKLCELFLQEVFKKGDITSLDEETILTINKFFENDLNVSETSRQLFVHRNTLVYRLEKMEGFSFAESIGRTIELNVVDGVILPNLMMSGEKESCGFLDQEGRCSIHPYRPGICRLFPLGRFYEEGSFRYFLQKDECPKARTKIKLSKWLDTPELSRYEEFVLHWHYLVKDLEEKVSGGDVEESKKWNMSLLKLFYFSPYDSSQDFFAQYENRCQLFQENPVQAC